MKVRAGFRAGRKYGVCGCVFWANPKTDHESIKSTLWVDTSNQIQIWIFEIHNQSVFFFWKGFQKSIQFDKRFSHKNIADLQGWLDSLERTFTSSTEISTSDEVATVGTMVGAAVSDVLTRASRFADSSVLPTDITQLVKSSLNRNRGSTSSIVQEIMGILNNLNCPDETELQLLMESFIAEAKHTLKCERG